MACGNREGASLPLLTDGANPPPHPFRNRSNVPLTFLGFGSPAPACDCAVPKYGGMRHPESIGHPLRGSLAFFLGSTVFGRTRVSFCLAPLLS